MGLFVAAVFLTASIALDVDRNGVPDTLRVGRDRVTLLLNGERAREFWIRKRSGGEPEVALALEDDGSRQIVIISRGNRVVDAILVSE
jgi:hypothetical protein